MGITNQQATKFTKKYFIDFDNILAMDKSNYQNNIPLVSLEEGVDKIKIILNESQPVKNFLVPDSYYAGNANFQ
jgi:protein-tyrosine phosphatase